MTVESLPRTSSQLTDHEAAQRLLHDGNALLARMT